MDTRPEISIKFTEKTDHPDHPDSSQEIVIGHEVGSLTLCSVHSEYVRESAPGLGENLKDDRLAGRWVVKTYRGSSFFPEASPLPLTVITAALIIASTYGNGLILQWRDDASGKPMLLLKQQLDRAVPSLATMQSKDVVQSEKAGTQTHFAVWTPNVGGINADFYKQVASMARAALAVTASERTHDMVRWMHLHPAWKAWLAEDGFAKMLTGDLGMFVRTHNPHFSVKEASTPGWAPPARLHLSRKRIQDILIESTLSEAGYPVRELTRVALRRAVEAKAGEGFDVLEVALEDAGDVGGNPRKVLRPTLMPYVVYMILPPQKGV